MRLLAFALSCSLALGAGSASAAEYWLFYLGGQSNMDGYGQNSELPPELQKPVEGVRIFLGNHSADGQPVDGNGEWAELKPGYGMDYRYQSGQATYGQRFGVELTFAQKLREAFPDQKIALLKYSRGGTSIDEASAGVFGSWDPQFVGGEGAGKGVNQYDHFLGAVRNATAAGDIDGDGEADTLVPKGILWMQGESDGTNEASAKAYRANLGELMNLIRAAFRYDDLPVVVGRISDSGNNPSGKVWAFGDAIREAQASFASEDGHAALVTSTDEYGYSDPWHYDSDGYLDLGGKFAEATIGLMK